MILLRKRENYNMVTMPGFSYLGSLMLTYTIVCGSEVAKGELEHVLKHYETLHVDDVFHGVHKRDITIQEKIVSFTTLGRHFKLHLTPNKDIFDENFRAYSVGPNDVKTEVPINKESFYRGYDEADVSSQASVHDDYGVLTASIATKDDTYIIEPAWRHLRKSNNRQMIAYRHSDVKSNITHSHNDPKQKKFSFCGHDSEHSTVYYKEDVAQDLRSHRRKRAVSTKIRCRLALVADYRFHQEMGQSDKRKTINYMIGVADRVDTIFQRTEWSSDYRGYGFEIAQVIVHETSSSRGPEDYNMVKNIWPIKDLLKAFSLDKQWKKYCLAHLFTYQDFENGVIGLAYVGNRKRNAVGGICTEDYFTNNSWLYLNTGLSSTINWGRKLLTEEADIVTAHEIGHNFGSEHDPDTSECAPDDTKAEGGKFIMYPASVSGRLQNNKEFSPCSKRRILEVLKSKSQFCFTEPKNEICGNYKKEANEECDPGGIFPTDTKCCTKNCKLQPTALCSDGYDSPCCRNCMYNDTTIKCREEDPASCKKATFCNGSSPSCPEAESMDNGTECLDSGKCLKGECLSFCAAENLAPCKCTEQENACKVCCVIFGRCQPHKNNVTGATLDVPNGRTCQTEEFQGTCNEHECQKNTQDLVERFWTFLTTLDSDKFAKFMKDNLAGTVVVFSLMIWMPASCYINRQDRKRDKQRELDAEWRDKKNTKLLRQPKPTSKGKFIYRQDSISRSSKPHKPYKVKAINIKTNKTPRLEYVGQRETYF